MFQDNLLVIVDSPFSIKISADKYFVNTNDIIDSGNYVQWKLKSLDKKVNGKLYSYISVNVSNPKLVASCKETVIIK